MLSLLHGTEKIISLSFQAIRQAGKRHRKELEMRCCVRQRW